MPNTWKGRADTVMDAYVPSIQGPHKLTFCTFKMFLRKQNISRTVGGPLASSVLLFPSFSLFCLPEESTVLRSECVTPRPAYWNLNHIQHIWPAFLFCSPSYCFWDESTIIPTALIHSVLTSAHYSFYF